VVRVLPFRALRYTKAAQLPKVVTPPHDVLTPAQKEAARRQPESIVHLILPEEGGEEGRFDRAAQLLQEWERKGVLARDAQPAFYRYEVTHGPASQRRTMHAFFARVGLDATLKEVRPHERTLSRKKGDRLRLRQATQCDVEPIWLLYRDEEALVDTVLSDVASPAVVEFRDDTGMEHRLWRVTDPGTLQHISQWFQGQTVVIADGHHRYQSALEHFAATGRPEDAAILACLARDGDVGIVVEATHRLVRWGRTWSEALASCSARWQMEALPQPKPQGRDWSRAAREVLQSLEGAGTAVLVGRDPSGVQARALWLQEPHASTGLGVTLVQEELLSACWGLEEASAGAITYERDAAECLRLVAEGGVDMAVLIPPERVESVLDAAQVGKLMPAKATYFVPKPASGIVLGPLDEG